MCPDGNARPQLLRIPSLPRLVDGELDMSGVLFLRRGRTCLAESARRVHLGKQAHILPKRKPKNQRTYHNSWL